MARDPGHGEGSGSATDRCSDQPPAAGGRRTLAGGGAREADRDLDAGADADSPGPRLHASSRCATVAAADTTPSCDSGGNTGWDLYRWHTVRVAFVQAAESTVLS